MAPLLWTFTISSLSAILSHGFFFFWGRRSPSPASQTPLLADNQIFYGYLSSIQDYPHDKLFPDLFMAETNEPLWRIKYLHPDYVADQKLEFVQGRCWDIYNFPLFSERFCNEFINVSEDFGQWSGGAYQDKRLKGGYEPVPTRDIHFNQYGFDRTW